MFGIPRPLDLFPLWVGRGRIPEVTTALVPFSSTAGTHRLPAAVSKRLLYFSLFTGIGSPRNKMNGLYCEQ